jgi:hypothetical protein
MTDVTRANFGYLIAYVLPGLLIVVKVSAYSATVRSWLGATPVDAPTVAGFLYVTLASVGAGLVVSALRWLVLDTIHHHTGVPRPYWDFSKLPRALAAFEGAVEAHYRYAQFYGNSLVALVIATIGGLPFVHTITVSPFVLTGATLALAALLFVASRDALQKYYDRTSAFLQGSQHRKEKSRDQWMAFETEKDQRAQGDRAKTRKANDARQSR